MPPKHGTRCICDSCCTARIRDSRCTARNDKNKKYYIAIVARDLSDITCNRSAFTSASKERAISAAISARDEWKSRGNGPYKIFVGVLTNEVVFPHPITLFEEVEIS